MEMAAATGDAMHAVLREAARAGPTAVDEHGAVHVLRHDELAEEPAALPWRQVLGRAPARVPVGLV